ncbi:MAG: DNA-3-methyladenine glycosylase [Candidatus Solibacter usitatus]|nr:DNA-3-methyladenine glycosylase [Candidatus Solibacter usitatus]
MPILPRRFYMRPAAEVAPDLLGMVLVHGKCAARIVETEAYLGERDPAAHAAKGLTPRTRVLYGPPGHAYVYLIYGMYHCLNIVTEPEGSPGCVLIRALEPLVGLDLNASGPGKLTRAMGITRAQNGVDLTQGEFTVRRAAATKKIAVGPRVGIRTAVDWPLRFAIAGNRYVSKPVLPSTYTT